MVASKPKPSRNKEKPDELKNKNKSDELHKTVCCHLCADEPTRRFLWEAMEKYTLLVNLLLEQVGCSSELEQWKRQGWVSEATVKQFCKAFEEKEQFKGLPSRFYMSAISLVKDTFEGWVKSQQRLTRKINGKKRWLKLVEEDIELAKTTDFSLEAIQNRAKDLLLELRQQQNPKPQLESSKDSPDEGQQRNEVSDNQRLPFSLLFDTYGVIEDDLSRHAIVHLLKNGGEVNEEIENTEELARRLATKREEIQRLEEQLASRLPKGRDPTGEQAINFLQEVIQLPEHQNCYPALFLFSIFYYYVLASIPYIQYGFYLLRRILTEVKIVESEFLAWEEAMTERLTNAAKIPNSLPYPLILGSTDDLLWSFEPQERNQQHSKPEKCGSAKSRKRPSKRKRKKLKTRSKERICVRFKGFSNCVFKVNCDRRQLPIFRMFTTDWQTYKQLDREKRSSLALFVLRSAKLIWRKDEQLLHKKGKAKQTSSDSVNVNVSLEREPAPPWETHRLYLHCSIDPNLLTAEGTEKVRRRKISETKKSLDNAKKKEQELLAQISNSSSTAKKQELENELIKKRRKILSYETSLIQLNNVPPRPSKAPYQGEANITVGISLCQKELIGVAVVDLQSQQLLEYYSVRKLLTDQRVKKLSCNRSLLQLKLEKYRLVNRLRKLRKRNVIHRQEEQKQGQYVESKAESNLGKYLERLIAARIVQIALEWRASSVVIPDLEGMREYIESAVQARAKQLFPNHRKQQQNYAKQFRIAGHRWSYKMLADLIRSRALSEGISVKLGRQPTIGSLANKALKMALSGHSLA